MIIRIKRSQQRLTFVDFLRKPLNLVSVECIPHQVVHVAISVRYHRHEVLVHRIPKTVSVGVGWNDGGLLGGQGLFEIRFEFLVDCVLLNVINYAESDCLLDRVDDHEHAVVNDRVFGQVETVVLNCDAQKTFHTVL